VKLMSISRDEVNFFGLVDEFELALSPSPQGRGIGSLREGEGKSLCQEMGVEGVKVRKFPE
jgi:hypothetical protein